MIKINDSGDRLKEERERLALSQAAFAEKIGVSRMSQFNYESGKRSPDAEYLAAADKIGVSVEYIVTGKRSKAWVRGISRVLNHLERRLNVPAINLLEIIKLVANDEANRNDQHWAGRFIEEGQLGLLIDAVIDDEKLIDEIFCGVGGSCIKLNKELPPDMFVRISLRLFQQFKESAQYDDAKVNEMVSIALM